MSKFWTWKTQFKNWESNIYFQLIGMYLLNKIKYILVILIKMIFFSWMLFYTVTYMQSLNHYFQCIRLIFSRCTTMEKNIFMFSSLQVFISYKGFFSPQKSKL